MTTGAGVGVSYFEFTRVMPTTQIPGSVDLTRPPKEVYVIMRGLFVIMRGRARLAPKVSDNYTS
jgi:hypothetical protein